MNSQTQHQHYLIPEYNPSVMVEYALATQPGRLGSIIDPCAASKLQTFNIRSVSSPSAWH